MIGNPSARDSGAQLATESLRVNFSESEFDAVNTKGCERELLII
jgi:hypothetical protein